VNQPRNARLPGAERVSHLEGSSGASEVGEDTRQPAGSQAWARTDGDSPETWDAHDRPLGASREVGQWRGTTEAEADAAGESEGRIGAVKSGNAWQRTRRSKGGPCRDEQLGRNTRGALTPVSVSTKLQMVAERAKQAPEVQLRSLAHLIDEEMLHEAFKRIRRHAAAGIDGMTKDDYEQGLDTRIRTLHERMKSGKYRHQVIRRVHIPKAAGKTRPIGISTVEDKVVQNALTMVLTAVYEQEFLECSYGFRPGRGAHDALRTLDRAAYRGGCNWVIEADIRSFFDSIDRKMLMGMLRERICDESLLRLIGKCMHVGVLDGESYSEPDEGTVQGSTLSPMLGNIYLHHVLDLWVEREVKPRMRGPVCLIRYADDFVLCLKREDDARRVMEVLPKRMAKYGLALHPDKTHLLPFARPLAGQQSGKGPANFDFLGFTAYWRRSHRGTWVLGLKTCKARLAKAILAIGEWCRRHRHQPVKRQHAALSQRLRGHYNYFGVNGNAASIARVEHHSRRLWLKWLQRRSQRSTLTWERFEKLLEALPLPRSTIHVRIWAR